MLKLELDFGSRSLELDLGSNDPLGVYATTAKACCSFQVPRQGRRRGAPMHQAGNGMRAPIFALAETYGCVHINKFTCVLACGMPLQSGQVGGVAVVDSERSPCAQFWDTAARGEVMMHGDDGGGGVDNCRRSTNMLVIWIIKRMVDVICWYDLLP